MRRTAFHFHFLESFIWKPVSSRYGNQTTNTKQRVWKIMATNHGKRLSIHKKFSKTPQLLGALPHTVPHCPLYTVSYLYGKSLHKVIPWIDCIYCIWPILLLQPKNRFCDPNSTPLIHWTDLSVILQGKACQHVTMSNSAQLDQTCCCCGEKTNTQAKRTTNVSHKKRDTFIFVI